MATEGSSSSSKREVNPRYLGQNGFNVQLKPQRPPQKVTLPDGTEDEIIYDSPLDPDLIYNDELAAAFLKHLGKPIPSADVLKDYVSPHKKRDLLKDRITSIRNAHRDEFDVLYTLQAEQIKRLQRDQALSWESWGAAKNAKSEAADREYQESVQAWHLKQRAALIQKQDETVTRLRHAHESMLLPLRKELAELKARINEGLPTTREAFEEMDEQPKYNVARWLLEEPHRRQLRQHWTASSAHALTSLYESNSAFRERVTALVQSKAASDPRKRR